MGKKKKILFFGELPPKSVHGVSFSNDVNISMLNENFDIDVIEEYIDLIEHGQFSIKKYISFLNYCFQVIKFSFKNKYRFFYLVYSLSFIGCIKTLGLIIIFKILNPRAKVITHIHRGDFLLFYNKAKIYKIISKLIFKLNYKTIILSMNFIDDNTPCISKFNVLPNTIKNPYEIPQKKDGINLLYISNYIKEKGIQELLYAIKELKNNKLELQCYGQFTSTGNKSQILSYESENIKINDYINNEKQKYEIIGSSTCLILPSYNEGQPLVILEAMSSKTIVIASKVGDIPNMLGNDYPLLIKPESTQSLKEAIIKLKNMDLEEKARLSEYLYNRYNNLYSNKVHQQKLTEIFN